MYEVNGNACDILVGLLGMCEVMGLHIYIALVDLDSMDLYIVHEICIKTKRIMTMM